MASRRCCVRSVSTHSSSSPGIVPVQSTSVTSFQSSTNESIGYNVRTRTTWPIDRSKYRRRENGDCDRSWCKITTWSFPSTMSGKMSVMCKTVDAHSSSAKLLSTRTASTAASRTRAYPARRKVAQPFLPLSGVACSNASLVFPPFSVVNV